MVNRISITVLALVVSGCNSFDKQKFEPVYRAGKAMEVEMASGVHIPEQRKALKAFQTEIETLKGRVEGEREQACLQAFDNAAAAYENFLTIRELDMGGSTQPDGRMLLGDSWEPRAKRFGVIAEPDTTPDPTSKYKWIWLNTSKALEGFDAAAKREMAEASRLVNQ
jgi:hypothetical protein